MTPAQPVRRGLGSNSVLFALLVLALGVYYTIYLQHVLPVLIGVGRVIATIEDFPYQCKRLTHPQLEACEDLWLDSKNRKLYAACSSIADRAGWVPTAGHFNTSARTGKDHISVLNIDEAAGSDGLYGLHQLELGPGFEGNLDLHGFDVREVAGQLRFWLINHRPSVDATGPMLDAPKVGANSTIEIFDLNPKTNQLDHVKTIAHEAIISPNDLAVDDDGIGFIITNDHPSKLGIFRNLCLFQGGSSLTYCRSDTGLCHLVAEKEFYVPNGIVKGPDDLFYVADSARGVVEVLQLRDGQVTKNHTIGLKVPIDNLALDAHGNIIAATMPDISKTFQYIDNPHDGAAPSAAWMIQKKGPSDYNLVKMVEDRDGKFLPTASVAVHDAQTQRLFFGGVSSPFITICENHSS